MRCDTPVYFQKCQHGEYDPVTGNYAEGTVAEEKRYADVTDARVETLNLVYGEIKQGSKVIRLQRPYGKSFDRIRIGEKAYKVDFSRNLRSKQTFIVSEVQ